MTPPRYLEAAKKACKRRNDAIAAVYQPPEWDESKLPSNLTEYSLNSGYYTPAELQIIQTSARDILANVAQRKWTSLAVTQAFCKAAALAQKLVGGQSSRNRVFSAEVLFEEALERARGLDEHLELTGRTVGPLHGLPISLKDCFIIAPYPASIGLAALANKPQSDDTVLVLMLRELGAVLYAKTNVPTSMLMTETTNCIWGECRNPLQKRLSPGGSSGGEAALIAFHGSPLGVGTDLGGSIRTPAAWCHLYGLKPSVGRFPSWGGMSGIPGQEFVPAVSGPMARELDSLRLFCETILSPATAPWRKDPKCLPMPWKGNVLQQGTKLRFGLIGTHDGVVHCHPPVERALGLVKTVLEAQGHEIVDWPVDDHGEILRVSLTRSLYNPSLFPHVGLADG
ncbi:putative amidase PB8B6.03 [Fonsecaea pedrosoi]|nr:putative amidase PB8B6.03 [Fonsecaea pedrosoi]